MKSPLSFTNKDSKPFERVTIERVPTPESHIPTPSPCFVVENRDETDYATFSNKDNSDANFAKIFKQDPRPAYEPATATPTPNRQQVSEPEETLSHYEVLTPEVYEKIQIVQEPFIN